MVKLLVQCTDFMCLSNECVYQTYHYSLNSTDLRPKDRVRSGARGQSDGSAIRLRPLHWWQRFKTHLSAQCVCKLNIMCSFFLPDRVSRKMMSKAARQLHTTWLMVSRLGCVANIWPGCVRNSVMLIIYKSKQRGHINGPVYHLANLKYNGNFSNFDKFVGVYDLFTLYLLS